MINSEVASSTYTIVSGVNEYPIGFSFDYNPDNTPQLRVYVNKLSNYPLVYGVDYTISDDQLNIVLDTSFPDGTRLDIIRDIPIVQLSDYTIGRIDPEQMERDLDLAVERDQQIKAQIEKVGEVPIDHEGRLQTVEHDIDNIESLIPAQTSEENQLADKDFVNSSIATNTANFKGTYDTLEELEAVTPVTNNDYGFVRTTDSLGHELYNRYKYSADTESWVFEYTLNNSSFTAVQWAAINSGITSAEVAKVNNMPVLITQVSVDEATGVVSVVAHTSITSLSVRALYGRTAISGNASISGSSATFTPTAKADILNKEWVIEVA